MSGRGGYEGSPLPIFFEDATLPLPVQVEGISIIKFNTNGSVTNIPASTKTTILTQAYVAGVFENLVIASVSGTNYAKFFLTINGVDVDIRRTAPTLNLQFDFTGAPYALNLGDIIDIKVEHFGAGLEDFEATLYGYN